MITVTDYLRRLRSPNAKKSSGFQEFHGSFAKRSSVGHIQQLESEQLAQGSIDKHVDSGWTR